MTDRSRDKTPELSEIRTVLSRAETALAELKVLAAQKGRQPDLDVVDMMWELELIVRRLGRWRKRNHHHNGRARYIIEAAAELA